MWKYADGEKSVWSLCLPASVFSRAADGYLPSSKMYHNTEKKAPMLVFQSVNSTFLFTWMESSLSRLKPSLFAARSYQKRQRCIAIKYLFYTIRESFTWKPTERECVNSETTSEKSKRRKLKLLLGTDPGSIDWFAPFVISHNSASDCVAHNSVSMQLLNWMILVYWLGRGRRGGRGDRAVHFSIRAHSEQKATVISSDLIVKHSGYKCDFLPSSCTTSVIWATSEWLQPLQDE